MNTQQLMCGTQSSEANTFFTAQFTEKLVII